MYGRKENTKTRYFPRSFSPRRMAAARFKRDGSEILFVTNCLDVKIGYYQQQTLMTDIRLQS